MGSIESDRVRAAVLDLLDEVCHGQEKGRPTWIISHDVDDASLLSTLRGVTAAAASTPVTDGGRTIAAHAEHVRWAFAYANAHLRGEAPPPDWSGSWSVREVDDAGWVHLREALEQEHRTLREAIGGIEDFGDEMLLRGVMASVSHAAYHLGAIRQIVRIVARG